jgi:hypothetical protein
MQQGADRHDEPVSRQYALQSGGDALAIRAQVRAGSLDQLGGKGLPGVVRQSGIRPRGLQAQGPDQGGNAGQSSGSLLPQLLDVRGTAGGPPQSQRHHALPGGPELQHGPARSPGGIGGFLEQGTSGGGD